MNLKAINKINNADVFILVLPIKKSVGMLFLFKKCGKEFHPELIIPCFFGKNGITSDKREGDLKTPAGIFELGFAFGICDNPGTGLDYIKINNSMYWVDDVNSEHYNKFVDVSKNKADFKSGEHLIEYPGLYDHGIVIEYNKNCIREKGSAIFLHCTDNFKKYTSGCIAVEKIFMIKILKAITKKENSVIAILDSM